MSLPLDSTHFAGAHRLGHVPTLPSPRTAKSTARCARPTAMATTTCYDVHGCAATIDPRTAWFCDLAGAAAAVNNLRGGALRSTPSSTRSGPFRRLACPPAPKHRPAHARPADATIAAAGASLIKRAPAGEPEQCRRGLCRSAAIWRCGRHRWRPSPPFEGPHGPELRLGVAGQPRRRLGSPECGAAQSEPRCRQVLERPGPWADGSLWRRHPSGKHRRHPAASIGPKLA